VQEWQDSASAEQVRQTGVLPKVELEERVPYVHADRDLLGKLLEQLVSQATWRSQPGKELGVRVRYNQEQVWLEVSDEGEVISEADMPHLFEKSSPSRRGALARPGWSWRWPRRLWTRPAGRCGFAGMSRAATRLPCRSHRWADDETDGKGSPIVRKGGQMTQTGFEHA
jgi:hypothetical protein